MRYRFVWSCGTIRRTFGAMTVAQRGEVALGDDGVGHFEQRSPALVLHFKRSLACDGRLLMAQVVDREGHVVTDELQEREIPGRRRLVRIGV